MAEAPCTQLVVVGSSAGGIGALSRLVSMLPEDFPAPIVIAQHLDPERESHLQGILARRSVLPVRTVSDNEPLESGVVFVVPANKHVDITDSHIGMMNELRGRPKPSVDLLLGSAAEVFGERLIAVVLTGTGNDGTDGARLVSERGGTVLIQNPDTAEFGGMPASLAPSTVDIIADLDEIVRILVDLLAGLGGPMEEPPEGEEGEFERLLEGLRKVYGVDFGSYKETTITRRLKRRMAATDQATVGEYRAYLAENPEEYRNLLSSFLIKVTEFFRDPEHFAYLQAEVLPRLVREAREAGRGLRVWSAGCATGEEAYSLAIALAEVLGDDLGTFKARIFATDVDEGAIEFARRGIYSASSVRGLSSKQLDRYFDEVDGQYQIKKKIRSMIVFGEHDLSRRSPFPNVDLCVSRNVLIYFAPELQRRALHLFAYSLRNGGCLVLGNAETVSPLSEYFETESRQYKVYRREGERFLMPPVTTPLPSPRPGRGTVPGTEVAAIEEIEAEASPRARGEDGLSRIPVGVVVVDRKYDIRAINTAARRLLSIHGAAAGEDFLHAMRDAPYAEVRAALDAAFRDGSASTGEFVLEDAVTGEPRHLRLDCYPRHEVGQAGQAGTVMIVVNDVSREALERLALEERINAMVAEVEALKGGAKAETMRLGAQNERLVEANRRFEEANRELGELNEELQTAYEESLMDSEAAQASTEEVETLNEELQATNEELETLNEELQATIEELNTTNEDLQARSAELQEMARDREEDRRASESARSRLQVILDRIPFGIVVYEGPELFLRLANPAFLRLFDRREADVMGKTFAKALPDLARQGREEHVRRVYEEGEPFSSRVEGLFYDRNGDGRNEELILDVTAVPLRDGSGDVEGVVMQIVDVTDQVLSRRHAEEISGKAREQGSRLEAILRGIVDAVLAVDAEGKVLFTNEAFRWRFEDGEVWEVGASARLGKFVPLDKGGEPMPFDEMPQVRASRGEPFEVLFAIREEEGGLTFFEARGHPFPGEDEAGGGVVVIREVTGD